MVPLVYNILSAELMSQSGKRVIMLMLISRRFDLDLNPLYFYLRAYTRHLIGNHFQTRTVLCGYFQIKRRFYNLNSPEKSNYIQNQKINDRIIIDSINNSTRFDVVFEC